MAPLRLVPVIALPRGPKLTAYDLIWLFPTVAHLSLVLARPFALGLIGNYISDWSPVNKGHLWGFIVQFVNVAAYGGDAFNVAGLIARTELGWTRFVRVLLQVVGVILMAHAASALLSKEFMDKHVLGGLPKVNVCGISDGGKSTCEMNYCDILDGMMGTCQVKKAGCCILPMYVVLDEIRHVFWFPFAMRMLAPWLGGAWGLLAPLAASVFQLMVRLPPSTMTGSWVNPSPHLLRSYLTKDYSYLHLIYMGTIGAQLAAYGVATLLWYLISLVSGGTKKPAPKAKAVKKGKKD